MSIIITLTAPAYAAGTYYRLPTEDGHASIYAMEGNWYQADGTAEDGNEYIIFWHILPGWDGEDESAACDWDHPAAVVRVDPWADVTAHAAII